MAEKIRYENKKNRLIDKFHQPTEEFIQIFMGDDAWHRLIHYSEIWVSALYKPSAFK